MGTGPYGHDAMGMWEEPIQVGKDTENVADTNPPVDVSEYLKNT